jgi:hypothetical protein
MASQTAGTAETLPNHPSRHQPDYCTLAQNFCRLGATNAQLAELFDVPTETIALWLADIPDFAEAVRHGRVMADAYVAESLFQRATGYVETVERIMMCRGAPMTVTYKKQHPPHVAASMEWLCNRRPQNWSWHGKKEDTAEDPLDLYAQPLLPCPAPALAEAAMPHEEKHHPAGEQEVPAPAAAEAGPHMANIRHPDRRRAERAEVEGPVLLLRRQEQVPRLRRPSGGSARDDGIKWPYALPSGAEDCEIAAA